MTNNTNVIPSPLLSLPDPRDPRRITHPLENILTIAVCAAMAGAEGWEDFESFGKAKRGLFSQFLDLRAGIPGHDVYRRVFNKIKPSAFRGAFLAWTTSILGKRLLGQIAIDGKCVRGSGNKEDDRSPLHMVSAWACEHNMVFAQVPTREKSNEITAIPELLKVLPLTGSLVSIDAMGCQFEIANQIIASGGSFLFALKGNQGSLHQDIRELIEDARSRDFCDLAHDYSCTDEKNRGRQETRTVRTFTDVTWLNERHKNWPHIQSIIVIDRIRKKKGDAHPHRETFYYISDKKTSARQWLTHIRDHWQVENSQHWILDVVFSEDDCQINDPIGAENFALLRHVALNVLKKDTTKKASIRKKRKIAGWDDSALIDFLKQV